MGQPLTIDEKMTLKGAAFGAVFLVSNADPGFLAMIKESFVASGALAGTAGLVKDALTTGDLPRLPRDTPGEVERVVLPGLRRSMEILRAKAPREAARYRATVLAAVERVAEASGDVDDAEVDMMIKIKSALGDDV